MTRREKSARVSLCRPSPRKKPFLLLLPPLSVGRARNNNTGWVSVLCGREERLCEEEEEEEEEEIFDAMKKREEEDHLTN